MEGSARGSAVTTKKSKPSPSWIRSKSVRHLRALIESNSVDPVLAFNEVARRYNTVTKQKQLLEEASQNAAHREVASLVNTLCAIFEDSDDYMWPEDIVSVIRKQSGLTLPQGDAP